MPIASDRMICPSIDCQVYLTDGQEGPFSGKRNSAMRFEKWNLGPRRSVTFDQWSAKRYCCCSLVLPNTVMPESGVSYAQKELHNSSNISIRSKKADSYPFMCHASPLLCSISEPSTTIPSRQSRGFVSYWQLRLDRCVQLGRQSPPSSSVDSD